MRHGLDKCEWDELWWHYCKPSDSNYVDFVREMLLEKQCTCRAASKQWWENARPLRDRRSEDVKL